MPVGKPAGVRCVQLDQNNRCLLFGDPRRPQVCLEFAAEPAICGKHRDTALQNLAWIEEATQGSAG